jgi:hypothetical protein
MLDRIKEHAEIYFVSAVLFPLAGLGFFALMHQRHEGKGAVVKSEIRALKRERETNQERLDLAPNSEYTASRQAAIRRINDEIAELEQELAK